MDRPKLPKYIELFDADFPGTLRIILELMSKPNFVLGKISLKRYMMTHNLKISEEFYDQAWRYAGEKGLIYEIVGEDKCGITSQGRTYLMELQRTHIQEQQTKILEKQSTSNRIIALTGVIIALTSMATFIGEAPPAFNPKR